MLVSGSDSESDFCGSLIQFADFDCRLTQRSRIDVEGGVPYDYLLGVIPASSAIDGSFARFRIFTRW